MRIIITGPSSSGKSTLINRLNELGYQTKKEIARKILKKRGFNLDSQKYMIKKQIRIEKKNYPICFYDRSVLDYIAFTRIFFEPNFSIKSDINKYDKIFNLEPIDFKKDGTRIENNLEESIKTHKEVIDTYILNGYSIINVKEDEIEKRIDFILNSLNLTKKK